MLKLLRLIALGAVLAAGSATAQDKHFDSNGVRIHYVEEGAGEPVVLLHGFAGSLTSAWRGTGVLADLSKDHRVVAMDLRGHGRSDKPHGADAYGDEMVQDVIRLMDHLKMPRAHVVGYSMGGVVAAKLVATRPDRVLTATLAGTGGRRTWTPDDAKAAEDEASAMSGEIPFRILLLRLAPPDQPKPSEETLRFFSQAIAASNDTVALAAVVRSQGRQVATAEQLRAAKVPLLAIVGSADGAAGRVAELKSAIPELRMVVIEGAVHSTADERGTLRRPEFVLAVRQFIASNRR